MPEKYIAGIEYDGRPYSGWQRQPHAPSVQACLEDALCQVANEKVRTITAGRTDTGVHATCQTVDFESSANRSPYQWLRGVNANLPTSIRMLWVQPVDSQFNARFCAIGRHYRYIILNRPVAPGILSGLVTWQPRKLDLEAMQQGARCLVGQHDFSAFRASACQAASPHRHVRALNLSHQRAFIWMDIQANGFLHHMVRNIAGSLMAVGLHERRPQWIESVLKSRDRRQAGLTAPAAGLYLVKVDYPAKYCVPDSSPFPVFW